MSLDIVNMTCIVNITHVTNDDILLAHCLMDAEDMKLTLSNDNQQTRLAHSAAIETSS